MAGLQDLLLVRQLRDQQDPLKLLAASVSQGIEAGRAEQKKKKAIAEQADLDLKGAEDFKNTYGGKIEASFSGGKTKFTVEDVSSDEGTLIQRARLKLAQETSERDERRLTKQLGTQDRLKLQQNMNFLNDVGKSFDPEDPLDVESMSQLGLDADVLLESGKAGRKSDGKIFVMDKKSRDRIEGEKTVPLTVQKFVSETKDTRDIVVDSLAEFKKMGLDKISIKDQSLIKQMFAKAGPLSAAARIPIINQFDNPKLAALTEKMERAFQKYRIKVTGVQASDKELARLRPLIFNLAQHPEEFVANAEDIIKELDQSVNNRIGIQRVAGRDDKILSDMQNFYTGGSSIDTPVNTGNSGGTQTIGRFTVRTL